MAIDFFAHVTQVLDDQETRIKALENALTKLPAVQFQPDPSRLPGVRVVPPALKEIEVPPNGQRNV